MDDSGGFERVRYDRELAILVLDGSGSMSEDESPGLTKAEAVRSAIAHPSIGLFAEFQAGRRVNSIDFAVLVFDTWVETRLPQTAAADIDLAKAYADLDVLQGHGQGTNIAQALDEAGNLAIQFADVNATVPQYATILLMSDGQHNVPTDDPQLVIEAAEKIRDGADTSKQRPSVILACAPYGPQADTQTLERIASPGFYQRCSSAKEIRAFFIRSLASKGV